ncbi:glycosyltransferase family 39 protein [Prevotella sp. 10(H)]|uniref:ArnT family glycosyltransferase n=1 Tax=Prevotella sp. 10(H) TaxID=1158294 RepID=UPI0012DC3096|nr:hypothetical protein [Prevotella sp. 10(H)]
METRENKNYSYCAAIILFLGIILRFINLNIPLGVYVDEAISGYDSWCLAYYGVDQHLASYPVYLKSWGTGQSALYAYFGIPFIKAFGLSISVYRLPMAIISCLSLILFYYTFRKTQKNTYWLLVVFLIFALNPWHIMKSRWALDCNLAPDFILMAISCFVLGYNSPERNNIKYIIASIFLVLAAYSYGASWLMLPFLTIFIFTFLYRKKRIRLSGIALCLTTMGILLFPLILFAIQLFTGGEQYSLGPLTITALSSARHDSTVLPYGGGIWNSLYYQLLNAIHLLVTGDDTYRRNTFYLIGQFYNLLGIPFIIIAIVYLIKRKGERNIFDALFALCLIASLPTMFIVDPSVHHWNVIWFPLIYFVARGIFISTRKAVWRRYTFFAVITCLSFGFGWKYITFFTAKDTPYPSEFRVDLDEAITAAKEKGCEKICMYQAFAHTLFYDPVDPHIFDATKKMKTLKGGIEVAISYAGYELELPEEIIPVHGKVYIIKTSDLGNYRIDFNKFHTQDVSLYTLLWSNDTK